MNFSETIEMINTAISFCPEQKEHVVYVLQMENGTVKIGRSKQLEKRKKVLENSSGLKIINEWCTKKMFRQDASKLETKAHKHFSLNKKRSEYFCIDFYEAVNFLIKHEG